ncbi:MAG: alpha/beta fold hydrolase [Gemmataceae bacterium]|nr:alpha/beta fold hydrolase [Gemmataceae bacterium]MDW8266191.1 alpha/beta fold hydrolase [Gemmataceae bacterium]
MEGSRQTRGFACWLFFLGIVAVAVAGCSYGFSVRTNDAPGLFDAWRASASEADELSPRTRLTLRRWDLEELYRDRPWEAFLKLHEAAGTKPPADVLFALAEISYVLGRNAERKGRPEACALYYLCAGFAYHFLFAPDERSPQGEVVTAPADNLALLLVDAPPSRAFDPRFRLACDFYNAGLAKCIRAAQKHGRLDPRQQLHLATPSGETFTLSVVHHGFDWSPGEFGPFLFCEDFRVIGLENQYRTYGLGVPLIGTRDAQAPPGRGQAFYPREVSFPVTAFFRFGGSIADLKAQRAGQLELYNPLEIQTVTVQGRTIPLETDLTTPLAYFLSRTDFNDVHIRGFLRADHLEGRSGIYMFEPYKPGKIPVVMIHGLLGSPLTWAPMFNDLRADPKLRKKFQFWFYLYPTAGNFLTTAADFRDALRQLRDELDPLRQDRALDEMVLVGHSMGGLVARLVTESSGDDFWKLVSDRPFSEVKGRPETLAELRRIFFFEQVPEVRRVVFLGTPHRGSKLSPSLPARIVVRFVRLPKRVLAITRELAKEDPELWTRLAQQALPNSVDLLHPKAPALELLSSRPRPPGVHYHSVIGDVTGKGLDGTDEVVCCRSAHLDDVDSEVIIPADHYQVHRHPRAVQEVQRILWEHVRQVEAEWRAAGPAAPPPEPAGDTHAAEAPRH